MKQLKKKDSSTRLSSQTKLNSLEPSADVPDYTLKNQHELTFFFDFLNKLFQANLAKITLGVSPAELSSAYVSWLAQLAQAPGSLLELAFYPTIHANDCVNNLICHDRVAQGVDVRFHKDSWQTMPWRLFAESFLIVEDWWQHATTKIPGVPEHVERTVSFAARQILDALSPSNFVLTNPELFNETIRTNGHNLIRGSEIGVKDMLEKLAGVAPEGAEHFIPGQKVAITPGKVVFSNHLIELIQYEAQTKTVYKEPILIVPAWIMKYYILDLSPENSLVKWLVAQGHTVFIISWRNPDKKDRNLSMDDYYRKGAMDAIDTVCNIVPKTPIHLMGYCLGGTLAIIAAAAMAGNGDKRLKSLSILASQYDFTEAGELMLFISESEVSFLKNMMWDQGYLDTKQMAGSFQMLRSYDLIWSKMVQDYMSGTQRGMIDLLAWNADATRMPYKMHSEYLEKIFLNNDLAGGRFKVEKELIAPGNVHLSIFAVSTDKDHVAPWQSVFKIHLLMNCDVTFVLTSGGHNAGVISEPNHPGRSYFIHERQQGTPYFGPKNWLKKAESREGSWWIAWHDWLVQQSTNQQVKPPHLNASLPAAPGKYVLQK
jgi:polyhydroxyalkanoate synthase